jgi:hypothetical protein
VDYLFKDIQKWREDVSSTILDTEVNKWKDSLAFISWVSSFSTICWV